MEVFVTSRDDDADYRNPVAQRQAGRSFCRKKTLFHARSPGQVAWQRLLPWRQPMREKPTVDAHRLSGGERGWSVRGLWLHARERPRGRPWHGARPLHGGLWLRARDVLLPSYVRRVSSITSVKRHSVAPETLHRPYARKNLHHVKISRKIGRFREFPFAERL